MMRLVLFPGALGDFISFYPALEWLRRAEPQATLRIGLRRDLGELLCAHDPTLSVASLDTREFNRLFVADAHADSALRAFFAGFDEIYSWTGFKDATLRRNLAMLAPGRARLFPFRAETPGSPTAEYYLSCVGGDWAHLGPILLPLRPRARAWAADYVEARGIADRPLLALAPGSGAIKKNWRLDKFAAVADWWRERGTALLILGPVEHERIEDAALGCPGALPVQNLSLDRLAALLARCRAMLGNDSGTTHLAAAVGIPTFAIFGPTDPAEWEPWGPRVKVIASQVSCAPCGPRAMKECSHQNCLDVIAPESVIRTMKERSVRGLS